MQSKLRTPIVYYGGKQKMAKAIISFIPKHQLYCEPFAGGAAVFFVKEKSPVEVLNDTNGELMNFYRVCKQQFPALQTLIKQSLHSRDAHDDAWVIYNKPRLFSEAQRAWAVWMLSCQSFGAQLNSSWGFDLQDASTTRRILAKIEEFTISLCDRLKNTQIECADALYIIRGRDRKDSLFYCDPPYFNSDMGHYDGYSEQDFENLLKILSKLKGKFLLSSYPSSLLQKYTRQFKWGMWSVEQGVSVNSKSGYIKRKVEVLTANYPL
jgi:DNA adenine methylase